MSPAEAGCAFEEIAQRHGDFAIAAAGCEVRLDGAGRLAGLSLGLGGVEERPIAVDTAGFIGRPADAATAKAIALHAAQSVDPMDDRGASADYRRALSQVLAERVVLRAAEAARQKGAVAR